MASQAGVHGTIQDPYGATQVHNAVLRMVFATMLRNYRFHLIVVGIVEPWLCSGPALRAPCLQQQPVHRNHPNQFAPRCVSLTTSGWDWCMAHIMPTPT